MAEPPVIVVHGISGGNRAAAADLYWLAFGRKLGLVMGPRPRALRFITKVMDEGHVLSAADEQGNLMGLIGFRTQRSGFVGGTVQDLRDIYGRVGASWRLRVLGLVAEELPVGVLVVDGLVVAPAQRGRGVGRALLGALEQQARRQGYSYIRLEVTRANRRARVLYAQSGFSVIRHRFSPLLGMTFGFSRSYTMQKAL